jgi:hypothetical protein
MLDCVLQQLSLVPVTLSYWFIISVTNNYFPVKKSAYLLDPSESIPCPRYWAKPASRPLMINWLGAHPCGRRCKERDTDEICVEQGEARRWTMKCVCVEVLTEMNMKITVIWNMTPCTLVHMFREPSDSVFRTENALAWRRRPQIAEKSW